MSDVPAPLDLYRDVVRSDWIDHNGHMNVGYYLVVFDFATDAWMDFIGLTRAHRREHGVTTFCLEAHVTYAREVGKGDPLRFTTRLLAYDEKRIHYFHEMYHATEGYLASTNEAHVIAREPGDPAGSSHGALGPRMAGAGQRSARDLAALAQRWPRHGPSRETDHPVEENHAVHDHRALQGSKRGARVSALSRSGPVGPRRAQVHLELGHHGPHGVLSAHGMRGSEAAGTVDRALARSGGL